MKLQTAVVVVVVGRYVRSKRQEATIQPNTLRKNPEVQVHKFKNMFATINVFRFCVVSGG